MIFCANIRKFKFRNFFQEIEIGHQQDNEEEKQFLEYQYGFKNWFYEQIPKHN